MVHYRTLHLRQCILSNDTTYVIHFINDILCIIESEIISIKKRTQELRFRFETKKTRREGVFRHRSFGSSLKQE